MPNMNGQSHHWKVESPRHGKRLVATFGFPARRVKLDSIDLLIGRIWISMTAVGIAQRSSVAYTSELICHVVGT